MQVMAAAAALFVRVMDEAGVTKCCLTLTTRYRQEKCNVERQIFLDSSGSSCRDNRTTAEGNVSGTAGFVPFRN